MHLFLRVFFTLKKASRIKTAQEFMKKTGEISLGWPDWLCCLKPACLQINTRKSPHVRESKTVSGFYPVDSWLLIPDSRYRIPASLSLEQSLVAFGILELYSGFQSLGFQIPQAKISQIPWTKKTNKRSIAYVVDTLTILLLYKWLFFSLRQASSCL